MKNVFNPRYSVNIKNVLITLSVFILVVLTTCSQDNVQALQNRKKLNRKSSSEPVFVNALIKITDSDDFNRSVLKSKKSVLVEFYSDWCPPCRKIAPLLNDFAVKHNKKISVYKVDYDYMRDLVKEYNIYGIPTLLLFSEGREVGRTTGFRNYEQIEAFVSDTLNW